MSERTKGGRRDEDTVRTVLARARLRARSVSQRCSRVVGPGVRAPTSGTVESVDPERLRKIRPAPRDVERDDAFERGLAAAVKLR